MKFLIFVLMNLSFGTLSYCVETKMIILYSDEATMENGYIRGKIINQNSNDENQENAGCELEKEEKIDICTKIISSKDFPRPNVKVCDTYATEKPLSCRPMTVQLSRKVGRPSTKYLQDMFVCPVCINDTPNETLLTDEIIEKLFISKDAEKDRWFMYNRIGPGSSIVQLYLLVDMVEDPVSKFKELNSMIEESNRKIDETNAKIDNVANRLEEVFKKVEDTLLNAKVEESSQKIDETSTKIDDIVNRLEGAFTKVEDTLKLIDTNVDKFETTVGKFETSFGSIGKSIKSVEEMNKAGVAIYVINKND